MALAEYLTRDGDTIDFICWKHYGRTDSGLVEHVLQYNQNVAFNGPILPAGLTIQLPDAPSQTEQGGTALWN